MTDDEFGKMILGFLLWSFASCICGVGIILILRTFGGLK